MTAFITESLDVVVCQVSSSSATTEEDNSDGLWASGAELVTAW